MQTDMAASKPVLADFLTEAELAAELGISVRTLVRWRRYRDGPTITRIGRRVYYHRAAIDDWLSSRQRPAM